LTDEQGIKELLQCLSSRSPQEAWVRFLQAYATLIHQAVRHFEREEDYVSECFLFVCEGLARDGYHRLRRFKPGGPARFSTWLRAVVRNLCLDWHRKEFGRQRIFESMSMSDLSALDQEVFRHLYERDTSQEETFLLLRPRFPGLTRAAIAESAESLIAKLSPRQRWLLSMRQPHVPSNMASPDEGADALEAIPDQGPSPEFSAILDQMHGRLRRAFWRLPPHERLLLQLRFEQELTLEQVARLAELGDAQRADRRIREVLARLRNDLDSGGKEKAEKANSRP
jgi:RNA polymerase sigma factor (sigma-70 family)